MAEASRQLRSVRLLSCEEFEERLCLSVAAFASHEISVTADGAISVYAVDLDGDGDVDVVSASHEDDKIAWYENTDGKGTFGEQQVITTADGADSVHAADLDGDGDVDALSATAAYDDNKIAWYEQLPQAAVGDANRDFQFDQLDIAAVLEVGKYLTGEAAEWGEGDWNSDGVFDQLDILAALQTGNYLRGPYAAADICVPQSARK